MINKWDLVDDKSDAYLRELKDKIRFQFPELSFVPLLTTSAVTGRGIRKLLNLLLTVRENSLRRLETGAFNRFVEKELTSYKPSKQGKQLKILYAVQTEVAPPSFTFFINDAKLASTQFRSYIKNTLRNNFGFEGVPILHPFSGTGNMNSLGFRKKGRRTGGGELGVRPWRTPLARRLMS